FMFLLFLHLRSRYSFPTRRSSDLRVMGCSGARFGYWFACFSLLLIATASVQVQAQARMKLLVSIKPLALIAQEVAGDQAEIATLDRKSTRLNSSHVKISYAVFCLK